MMKARNPFRRVRNYIKRAKTHFRIARAYEAWRLKWVAAYTEIMQGGTASLELGVPVDSQRKPRPWITYPAIEFLEQFDFSQAKIFEYGSGNSSKWWAERCARITSVESDPQWYDFNLKSLSHNQLLHLKTTPEAYINSIYSSNSIFDVIVIDGIHRYDCAIRAIDKLATGGIIILDNSDWYKNTSLLLEKRGLLRVDFIGLSPLNTYASCTSIFFMRNFSFLRKSSGGEIEVIGGLKDHPEDDRQMWALSKIGAVQT